MVEQHGGTGEQPWWNRKVEKWNSQRGTVWWNSETLMVEQCGDGTVKVEQCGQTVKQSWWNTVVQQGDSDGRTMGESLLNCVVEQWKSHGGKV